MENNKNTSEEDAEVEINEKLKRLEEKVKKQEQKIRRMKRKRKETDNKPRKHRKRSRRHSSDRSTGNSYDHSPQYRRHDRDYDSSSQSSARSSPRSIRNHSKRTYESSSERRTSLPRNEPENELQEIADKSSQEKPDETSNLAKEQTGDIPDTLDPDVLEAIGKRLDTEIPKGPPIQNEILIHWSDIVKEGLPKEEIKDLLKKYKIPENCSLVEPPKLNAEIKTSLLEPLIKRDEKMIEKQQKVAVCLAALGTLLTKLTKKEDVEKVSLITTLSDTARLLVDLQREETRTRRLIILSNLNPSIKETLNATKSDDWLFGKELNETLKTAKSLEKSSKDLKQIKKPQPTTTTTKAPKNSKGPPRQTPYHQKGTRGQQRSYNPYNKQRSSYHRRQSSGRTSSSSYRRHR